MTKEDFDFKFNEGRLLEEIRAYIEKTYGDHYNGRYQATDMIIDAGHGEGFCIGNIMKYAKRYGRKNGKDRRDLLKIVHYAIISLYVHDSGEAEAEAEAVAAGQSTRVKERSFISPIDMMRVPR